MPKPKTGPNPHKGRPVAQLQLTFGPIFLGPESPWKLKSPGQGSMAGSEAAQAIHPKQGAPGAFPRARPLADVPQGSQARKDCYHHYSCQLSSMPQPVGRVERAETHQRITADSDDNFVHGLEYVVTAGSKPYCD